MAVSGYNPSCSEIGEPRSLQEAGRANVYPSSVFCSHTVDKPQVRDLTRTSQILCHNLDTHKTGPIYRNMKCLATSSMKDMLCRAPCPARQAQPASDRDLHALGSYVYRDLRSTERMLEVIHTFQWP